MSPFSPEIYCNGKPDDSAFSEQDLTPSPTGKIFNWDCPNDGISPSAPSGSLVSGAKKLDCWVEFGFDDEPLAQGESFDPQNCRVEARKFRNCGRAAIEGGQISTFWVRATPRWGTTALFKDEATRIQGNAVYFGDSGQGLVFGAISPVVTVIAPDHGKDSATCDIQGSGFIQMPAVRLKNGGQGIASLNPTVTAANNGCVGIRCVFGLAGQAPGPWVVSVTNPPIDENQNGNLSPGKVSNEDRLFNIDE
jgi:hypothetical protein